MNRDTAVGLLGRLESRLQAQQGDLAQVESAREIARKIWPTAYISVGSDILREVREFERTSTAALPAPAALINTLRTCFQALA